MSRASSSVSAVACGLFDLIDAVDVVLEIESAEEEGHDRAETQSDGLDGVVELLERVLHGEAIEDDEYESSNAQKRGCWRCMGYVP
ncbi:hypothetical protein CPI13_06055 [Moraxella catarrhalis]|nr:hypothetical protein [Moraxella catarrhalis]